MWLHSSKQRRYNWSPPSQYDWQSQCWYRHPGKRDSFEKVLKIKVYIKDKEQRTFEYDNGLGLWKIGYMIRNIGYTVFGIQYSVYNIQYMVYDIQYTGYGIQKGYWI